MLTAIADMEKVHFFVPSQSYLQRVADLFEEHRNKILHLVPTAEVEHIGATSVPGLLTKGDLDLQVSMSPERFNRAIVLLQTEYSDHQLENWTESFASFKYEKNSDIPVGVQLVIQGSESDFFVKSRELLLAQPEKVEELNRLKQCHEDGDMDTYIKHKGEFFTTLLENSV
jgi:GrpB-like predicted nucleotidyltransferase (UPF0157 family)